MQIVAIVSSKGGVGKTTITQCLAVEALQRPCYIIYWFRRLAPLAALQAARVLVESGRAQLGDRRDGPRSLSACLPTTRSELGVSHSDRRGPPCMTCLHAAGRRVSLTSPNY